MIFLQTDKKGDVSLTVYAQPRASADQICGVHGGALKVRITAPPVDDKANAKLINFFAKLFNLPKSSLSIAQGKQSRTKRIVMHGADVDEVEKILREALS